MNNFFKTIIAGYGAKKLGGGCFSTILIFIVIYWALGTCNRPAQQNRGYRTGTGMHTTPVKTVVQPIYMAEISTANGLGCLSI